MPGGGRRRQAGAVWYDYSLIYMICICITHTVLPVRLRVEEFDKARTPDKDAQDILFLSAGLTCVQRENSDQSGHKVIATRGWTSNKNNNYYKCSQLVTFSIAKTN